MPDITSFPISAAETGLTVQQLKDAVQATHTHANLDVLVQIDHVPVDGAPGAPGKSAYEIWLDSGNTGTEQDFLDSLGCSCDGNQADAEQLERLIDDVGKLVEDVEKLSETVSEMETVIDELKEEITSPTPEPGEQSPATNGSIPSHISPDGGAAPFYSFTGEQFDGTVTWEPPVENTFDFDTAYTATIALTPRPGVTFEDVDPGIFDIGVPGASVSFDPETATATISFPKTADAPDVSASWQMNYTFPGSKVLFTAASGGRIPLESMSGYDGTQALSDELYYIESPDDMPVSLLYKYDGDTDWREALFDNFGTGQTGSNTIRNWGWDTGSQSIYIVGSNSTGADIQITLVREGLL